MSPTCLQLLHQESQKLVQQDNAELISYSSTVMPSHTPGTKLCQEFLHKLPYAQASLLFNDILAYSVLKSHGLHGHHFDPLLETVCMTACQSHALTHVSICQLSDS